jgi:ubiquinone/menaquinone biosynthesis C-methylase UbiE
MLESISRGKAVSFYQAHVYPHLVKILGDPKTIRQVRQRTVSLAHGTGPRNRSRCRRKLRSLRLNKPRKLYALEPNPGMIRLAARERDRLKLAVEFLECPGECIPLEGSSVDPIVWTFALCTIANVADTMQEIGRVLKPGGDLISFEIGVSPDAGVRRWQEWWEPARR